MLQIFLSLLTNPVVPNLDDTVTEPNCSVHGRIHTIYTHGQNMKVCIIPWEKAAGDVYQFTTSNQLHQAHLLSAKLGNRLVSVESHAPGHSHIWIPTGWWDQSTH